MEANSPPCYCLKHHSVAEKYDMSEARTPFINEFHDSYGSIVLDLREFCKVGCLKESDIRHCFLVSNSSERSGPCYYLTLRPGKGDPLRATNSTGALNSLK